MQSALSATPGAITQAAAQTFRLTDLVEERGKVTASTKYQVALIFPVPVDHVAVPVLKQSVFKATVAGKIVYLDVAKAGGRATLSVSLGDAGLAQFDVALTDREDGVTRYTISESGPARAPAAAVIRATNTPAQASPLPAPSSTPARAAPPKTAATSPIPLPVAPPLAVPRAAAPVPSLPRVATSSSPATPRSAASSSRDVRALTQPLVTRGLTLTFTTRRDGANTLVTYRVTGSASLRPEDLTVQDALGAKVPATFLEKAAKPGAVYGKLRVASNASLLRVRWAAKAADGSFFPITKTLFVR